MKKKRANAARLPGKGGTSKPTFFVKYGLVLLIILFAAFVRIRFLDSPLERDEGEYAYAGQLILQGVPPYQLAYNMKLPGTYAAYALILAVLGQTPTAIHAGLLIINAGAAFLIYLIGTRLFGPLAGHVACAAFAFLSLGQPVFGTAGHATHFVLIAALGGILLLLKAMERRQTWTFFWSGLLAGLSFVMKQPGIFFVMFTIAHYLLSEWRTRLTDRRRFIRQGSILALGIIAPFLMTCLLLWVFGVFERFWFWTFSYAREYVTQMSFSDGFHNLSFGLARVIGPSFLIWALAAIGISALIWDRDSRAQRPFMSGLLLFSFLSLCPGFYFREHYFILILPVVALLTGLAVSSTGRFLERVGWPRIFATLIFLAALCVSLIQQRSFIFDMDPITACRAAYGANPFPESRVIAKYIREHTDEGDRIAVIGSEPEIYFYSGRRSATGYIYTYGLVEEQKYASQMQKEMISEIESARPMYLVMVYVESWFMQPGSDRTILAWADQFAEKNYELDGAVDILSATQTVYRWGEQAKNYQVQSPHNLKIFRRIRP